MSGVELLPCPFCGGIPHKHLEYDKIEAGDMGPASSAGMVTREKVSCQTCGASAQSPNPYSRFNWNSRAA